MLKRHLEHNSFYREFSNMKLLYAFVLVATILCSVVSVEASLVQGMDGLYPAQDVPKKKAQNKKKGAKKG